MGASGSYFRGLKGPARGPAQPFSRIPCPKRRPVAPVTSPLAGDRLEDALIARARAGDPTAERELYDAHVDRIYRLAFRFAGSDDLARDFTQDAFIRAFSRLNDFRGDSKFSTWLHTIAVSVILNGMRKVKTMRQREAPLDDAMTLGTTRREAEPDLKQRLAAAIAALPEGYRTVFLLHDAEGYTHEEIGEVLGVQPGTSKAQLSRARAKLRDALQAFAGEWA